MQGQPTYSFNLDSLKGVLLRPSPQRCTYSILAQPIAAKSGALGRCPNFQYSLSGLRNQHYNVVPFFYFIVPIVLLLPLPSIRGKFLHLGSYGGNPGWGSSLPQAGAGATVAAPQSSRRLATNCTVNRKEEIKSIYRGDNNSALHS